MKIRTSQGHTVEIIEPPLFCGDWFRVRVAVDGIPCPSMTGDSPTWARELHTLPEPEFWQNVADAALSMREVQTT